MEIIRLRLRAVHRSDTVVVDTPSS
jgi:hypothetical protein